MNKLLIVLLSIVAVPVAFGREYHVSVSGDDAHDGATAAPLRTISAAARLAQPGDVITVHAGVYRERIAPPRGGESDQNRITYQAAAGEKVVIKGSEPVKGWEKVQNDTWKAVVPHTLFKDFNPFNDLIHGDWFNPMGRSHHTGAVYLKGHWLTEAAKLEQAMEPAGKTPFWFAQVDASNTTIWAQFPGADPNEAEVEINVRRTVFYPEKPGMNYITVRGFTMMHAATPWAPPTAEQVGLIGTHWSKGWIIENNDVCYSTCVGIALGKYGDQWDNTSADTAEGYVKTIERAEKNASDAVTIDHRGEAAKSAAGMSRLAWSRKNIGHHIVRNNHVSHCEQAGIVGSLGPVFCIVTGNEIHDIHVRRLFSGAEMAGIKFHAAIDTEISHNHIYRTCRGIWLDWMAQGTHVTGNLLHDNAPAEDLMVEVDHGPFLVDNNVFLSPVCLFDMSEGGAYVHNLFAGKLGLHPELGRETPFMKPHSTEVAGLRKIPGGDSRFYNNIFVGPAGLASYDKAALPMFMAGNVFLKQASAGRQEKDALVMPDFDPALKLAAEKDATTLHITLDKVWAENQKHPLVTTDLLGKAKIPDAPFEKPDGSPCRIDTDYLGKTRGASNPFPGPFELPAGGEQVLKVWPVGAAR